MAEKPSSPDTTSAIDTELAESERKYEYSDKTTVEILDLVQLNKGTVVAYLKEGEGTLVSPVTVEAKRPEEDDLASRLQAMRNQGKPTALEDIQDYKNTVSESPFTRALAQAEKIPGLAYVLNYVGGEIEGRANEYAYRAYAKPEFDPSGIHNPLATESGYNSDMARPTYSLSSGDKTIYLGNGFSGKVTWDAGVDGNGEPQGMLTLKVPLQPTGRQ